MKEEYLEMIEAHKGYIKHMDDLEEQYEKELEEDYDELTEKYLECVRMERSYYEVKIENYKLKIKLLEK